VAAGCGTTTEPLIPPIAKDARSGTIRHCRAPKEGAASIDFLNEDGAVVKSITPESDLQESALRAIRR
jgi:hypothetical protein